MTSFHALRCAAQMTLAVLASAIFCMTSAQAQKTETKQITVFAAASLKNALDEASAGFTQSTGNKVTVSYAASSALAKQIEQAAPADVFISADLDWMDYLASKDLILPQTRSNFLGNQLVLIGPAANPTTLEIKEGFPLAAAIGDGRLATADVKSVPAGKYAKAALEKLQVWSAVEPRLAQTENVRAALALVAQGEAQFGIVYKSDAVAEPKVKVVGVFPETSHPPIIYPIALVRSSGSVDTANALLSYLLSPQGQDAFKKQGFTILK